jgi:hypothetical protein
MTSCYLPANQWQYCLQIDYFLASGRCRISGNDQSCPVAAMPKTGNRIVKFISHHVLLWTAEIRRTSMSEFISSIRSLFVKKNKKYMADSKSLAFYSQFIRSNSLCFDVGANAGSRTGIFLAQGAKVVAVEPQDQCVNNMKQRFGGRKSGNRPEGTLKH